MPYKDPERRREYQRERNRKKKLETISNPAVNSPTPAVNEPTSIATPTPAVNSPNLPVPTPAGNPTATIPATNPTTQVERQSWTIRIGDGTVLSLFTTEHMPSAYL